MQDNNRHLRNKPRRASIRRIYYERIIILITLICAAVALLTYLFYPKIERPGTFKVTPKAFYFLQISKYQDFENAALDAAEEHKNGGAGFIVVDSGFLVITQVFTSETVAAQSCAALRAQGKNALVYPLSSDPVNLKVFGSEQVTKDVYGYFEFPKRLFDRLINIAADESMKKISVKLADYSVYKLGEHARNIYGELLNLEENEGTAKSLKLMYAGLMEAFAAYELKKGTGPIQARLKNLACAVAYEYNKSFKTLIGF